MKLYVYAITDMPDEPLSSALGLCEASPAAVGLRDIAAVVSPISMDEIPQTEENLWRHEQVLEALMDDRAVLPVRFGTVLADEADVERSLEHNYDEFASRLGRVRGHVEIALRVLWDGAEPEGIASPAEFASGRDYMLCRVAEEREMEERRQHAEVLADELDGGLSRLASESTRKVQPAQRMFLHAAYLVPVDAVEDFKTEVGKLSDAHPDLRFLCTGPWPPFSFVGKQSCAPRYVPTMPEVLGAVGLSPPSDHE